jgi:MFS family permease
VQPWSILAAALVAQVGVSVVEQGIPIMTGYVKTDLGVSAALAGLLVSAFAFGRIFGAYAAGVAADRVGERTVLLLGGVATGGFVLVAAPLPLAGLVIMLALAGFASAASTPAGGRVVLVAFPRNRHGLALGLRQAGIPLGGLIAAAVLPSIAHVTSFRVAFAVAALICLGATGLFYLHSGMESREERTRSLRAQRGESPARDRNVRLLTAWGCLVVTGQYCILAYLALDLHASARLTLATASILVAVAQVAGIVGRVAWGALSDHTLGRGRKPVLFGITSVGLLSSLLLLAVPRSAPLAVLGVIAFVAGLGLVGWQGMWVTMMAESVGPERAGAATGFGVGFVAIVIAVTPPLFGLAADLAHTYRAIWAVLTLVLVVSFVPAALVRERSVG